MSKKKRNKKDEKLALTILLLITAIAELISKILDIIFR